jgi:hypothetical protein
VDFAVRLAEVRSRAASLPGSGEVRALEAAALTRPRRTRTPTEIRALAAEAVAQLHEVAGELTELSGTARQRRGRRGEAMSARDDKNRQVVAELDVHIAEVEARVAILKALLADDEVPVQEAPG